jgi:WhiB family redox-sensing transcriptional regulator
VLDLPLLPARPMWMRRAACRGLDPELFFPVRDQHVNSDAENARVVCASCSVRSECLEYALANEEQLGMWGGLSIEQRRALKRRRRAQAS